VSEWIRNGTSAQLGYTVPFILVHDGQYRKDRRQVKKYRAIKKLNITQKKTKQCKTQQNKTSLV